MLARMKGRVRERFDALTERKKPRALCAAIVGVMEDVFEVDIDELGRLTIPHELRGLFMGQVDIGLLRHRNGPKDGWCLVVGPGSDSYEGEAAPTHPIISYVWFALEATTEEQEQGAEVIFGMLQRPRQFATIVTLSRTGRLTLPESCRRWFVDGVVVVIRAHPMEARLVLLPERTAELWRTLISNEPNFVPESKRAHPELKQFLLAALGEPRSARLDELGRLTIPKEMRPVLGDASRLRLLYQRGASESETAMLAELNNTTKTMQVLGLPEYRPVGAVWAFALKG